MILVDPCDAVFCSYQTHELYACDASFLYEPYCC
jgi:hypothetical protein